jgi:hypothetical protein
MAMHPALQKSGSLTLKHFILRQQVLDFYRSTIRASRGLFSTYNTNCTDLTMKPGIPDPVTRQETRAWIRGEIERGRHLSDAVRGTRFLEVLD